MNIKKWVYKIWVLILFLNTAYASSTLDLYYNYQYDTNGYQNNQITTKINVDNFSLYHQHNQTISLDNSWYETLYASYRINQYIKLGFGGIYGDHWDYTPGYVFEFKYFGYELSGSRIPIGSQLGNMLTENTPYPKLYLDEFKLKKAYVINSFQFSVEGIFTEYQNNNHKEELLTKTEYNFSNNYSAYFYTKNVFYDHHSDEYFSPYSYQFYLMAFHYNRELGNEFRLDVKVGPAITYINQESSLRPYYDINLMYNNMIDIG